MDESGLLHFVEQARVSFVRKYCKTVEAFLRSLGVTEEAVSEYEFRTQQGDLYSGEIWHGEIKVGVVSVRFDGDNPANGYRCVVECFAADKDIERPDNNLGERL